MVFAVPVLLEEVCVDLCQGLAHRISLKGEGPDDVLFLLITEGLADIFAPSIGLPLILCRGPQLHLLVAITNLIHCLLSCFDISLSILIYLYTKL